ncbi:hypothetical protein [Plantactinospora sp. GCM10030261]|uniref:hypothetical protein n=1 Tax=Plantactinospora sp. GCM10030261 TaxID=3273420 RepID=UPI00360BC243
MTTPGLTRIPLPPARPAAIFRLVVPESDDEAIFRLARRFDLAGSLDTGTLHRDARHSTYVEGPYRLILHHASGGFRLHDTTRWQVDDGESHVTLEDEAAVAIARRHLHEAGIASAEDHEVLRVSRLHVAVAEPATGSTEERIIDVAVTFHRLVDKIPVLGPGGKITVYVDHERRVTGVDSIGRAIEGVVEPEAVLRPPESVLAEVERAWSDDRNGLVSIDDMVFGYFEADWDEPQAYLQPAYVLLSTVTATEGLFAGRQVTRSVHPVPAAVDPPGPLMAPPPVLEPPSSSRE